MADYPTVISTDGNGLGNCGGAGLLGGIGGLILGGLLANGGGFGGWGGGNNGAAAAAMGALANANNNADQTAILSNAITHTNDSVVNGQMANLNAALTKSVQDGSNALASANQLSALVAALNNTVTGGFAGVQTTLCQNAAQSASCCCDVKNAVIQGNLEGRLATQQQTSTLQESINNLSREVERESCQTRELMRQIQSENTNVNLADAKNQIAQLQNQISLTDKLNASQSSQNVYLTSVLNQILAAINALGGATRTTSATAGA